MTSGFPHSDILGSKGALASPRLIAECHVLHRLLLPRHPPNALLALDPIQKKTGPFACSRYRLQPISLASVRKSFDPRALGSRLRARRQRLNDRLRNQKVLSVSVFLTWKDCPCSSLRQGPQERTPRVHGDGPACPPLGTDTRTSRVLLSERCHLSHLAIRQRKASRDALCNPINPARPSGGPSGHRTRWTAQSAHSLSEMVGRGGVEPPTSRLSGVRSNHLSYRPIAVTVADPKGREGRVSQLRLPSRSGFPERTVSSDEGT